MLTTMLSHRATVYHSLSLTQAFPTLAKIQKFASIKKILFLRVQGGPGYEAKSTALCVPERGGAE